MKYIGAWIVIACIVALTLGQSNWMRYRRLAQQGIRVQATVLQLLPETHQIVRYEYEVAGRTLQGEAHVGAPNPPFDQIVVSQKLIAYYDPGSPLNSVISDPAVLLQNETVSITLGAVLLATALVLFWRFGIFRRRFSQALVEK